MQRSCLSQVCKCVCASANVSIALHLMTATEMVSSLHCGVHLFNCPLATFVSMRALWRKRNIFLYIQIITKWKCARLTKTCLFFQCKVVFICLQSGMSSIISFYLTSWTEIHLWAKFLEKCPFIPGDITRSELRNNKMNWNYWLGLQC